MDIVTYVLARNESKNYTDEQIAKFPKYASYKGAVDYFKDLPTDAELSDTYTVRYAGEEGTIPSGAAYIWTGEDWSQINIDFSSKQDKLISGQNIKTINDISLLGEGNIELQKKLEAGSNITIKENPQGKQVISSTGAVFSKTFDTDIDVGHLKAGSKINKNVSVESVLNRMLYGGPGQKISLYFGATKNEPDSLDGLEEVPNLGINDLTFEGYKKLIIAGDEETEEAEYPVIAVPKGIVLSNWRDDSLGFKLEFEEKDMSHYRLYYLIDKSYDAPEGIRYKFEFVEENIND